MSNPGPIPIQSVQIQPPFVQSQSGFEQAAKGLEIVSLALQRRQELEQAKADFLQRQEEFELRKKLTGTQIAGFELEQEKMKRQFKAEDEKIAARDKALRIFTGNIPQANDMKAWGQVMSEEKDPLVAEELMNLVQDMFTLRGKAGEAEGAELKNQAQILSMAEDRQISQTLQRLSGRQWNRQTIRDAIGRVVAINPQKAGTVAQALNAMLPDYQIVIGDRGEVDYVPKSPGEGAPLAGGQVAPKRPTDEQNKLATYAYRVLENNARMTELENAQPGIGQKVDDRLRTLRGIEQIPVAGRAAATWLTPQFLRGLSKQEREYVNARVDLGNAFLRRASGAQINLEELDRETSPYVPTFRQGDDVVPSIQFRRLQQGLAFAEQSANAFNPNRLSPNARRYLLQNIVPNPGYSPDNPFNPNKQPGTALVPQ